MRKRESYGKGSLMWKREYYAKEGVLILRKREYAEEGFVFRKLSCMWKVVLCGRDSLMRKRESCVEERESLMWKRKSCVEEESYVEEEVVFTIYRSLEPRRKCLQRLLRL
jgi:hypothetical protein